MFGSVQIETDQSRAGNRLKVTGLNLNDLRRDLRKLFGPDSPYIKSRGTSLQYHVFSVVIQSWLWNADYISFEAFFALEVLLIFTWLYKATNRQVYGDIVRQLNTIPRLQNLRKPDIAVPATATARLKDLNIELMDYQTDFLKQYYNAVHRVGLNGYVMAFEQGLGKTYTALSTVYALDLFPCVITAPKSTLLSWRNSILQLIPHKALREDVIQVGKLFTICNYESLGKLEAALTSPPQSLIVDEIQNFRFMNTARTQKVIDIQRRYNITNVIALSGTPIKALAAEMIPVMTMIDPYFRDSQQAQYIFKYLYSKPQYDAMASAVLKDRLRLYMVRKEVSEVLDLPKKTQASLPLKVRNIKQYTITATINNIKNYIKSEKAKINHRNIQLDYEELYKALSILPDSEFRNNFKEEYVKLIKKWMSLSPVSDAYDATRKEVMEMEEVMRMGSRVYRPVVTARKKITSYNRVIVGKAIGEYVVRGKTRLLCEAVNENMNVFIPIIRKSLKKTIVFSTVKEPLDVMSANLTRAGIKNMVIDSGADYNKRSTQFLNDPECRVILGTIQAIGTGTDGLQYACNTAIFLNRPFRSTDLDQAEARIYRKGQDTDCTIYYVDVEKGTPNILGNEQEINEWSRKMLSLAGV